LEEHANSSSRSKSKPGKKLERNGWQAEQSSHGKIRSDIGPSKCEKNHETANGRVTNACKGGSDNQQGSVKRTQVISSRFLVIGISRPFDPHTLRFARHGLCPFIAPIFPVFHGCFCNNLFLHPSRSFLLPLAPVICTQPLL
jgi:hypothetical protein